LGRFLQICGALLFIAGLAESLPGITASVSYAGSAYHSTYAFFRSFQSASLVDLLGGRIGLMILAGFIVFSVGTYLVNRRGKPL